MAVSQANPAAGLAASPVLAGETEGSPGRVVGFLLVAVQLGLILAIVSLFDVARRNHFFPVLCLAVGGYLVHAWLPALWRAPFFCVLSLGSILLILGWPNGAFLIGVGGGLIALSRLPIALRLRVALLLLAGLGLANVRVEHDLPFWPVLGSMFMFRLIGYLFDLRHGASRPPLALTLAYFFPLPNVSFLFFPVLDFKTFRETYRPTASWQSAQGGVGWMVVGLSHLLLYRIIKYYLLPSPHQLGDAPHLLLFLATNYALYLHVSGYFHLITGIFHLFGFELPRTHHHYFLASSFSDIWRRINIYWKDFMTKVFFMPTFFALRRWGNGLAAVMSALFVFLATWLLHAYQVFWLSGSLPLELTDAALWFAVGILAAWNLQRDLKRAARPGHPGQETSLLAMTSRSARVVGMFVLVSLFWACWNTPSFLGFLRAQVSAGRWLDGWGWVLGLLAIVVSVGVVAQSLHAGLTRRGVLPVQLSPARAAMLSTVALAAAVLVGTVPTTGLLGPQLGQVIASLRLESATPAEAAQAVQGYYEEIADAPVRAGSWLTALEGRLTPPRETHYTDMSRPADDLLERELIPGWQGEVAGRQLTVNRLGMRDRPDRAREKPPGTRRIALVGSSVVMGFGVGDDETFARLLEDQLNAQQQRGDQPYEVLNFGTGKSFVIQRHVLIDRKVFGFQPDAIYYVAHQDELLGPVKHLAKLVAKGQELPYPCLREVIREAGITSDMSWGTMEARLHPFARAIVVGVYRDLVAECRERGILLVWIYLPMPGVVEVPVRSAEFVALAQEAGFVVLNLADWADGYPPAQVKLGDSDHHANALGHRIIAERLVQVLRQNPRLLPRSTGAQP